MSETREIALLFNPAAGRGRGHRIRDVAVARLRQRGVTVRSLEGADVDEARELAQASVDDGVDALVVCGGDGLVNVALQALAGTDVPLGLVPAGTGNDAGRYIGVTRADPLAAVDRILAGRTRAVDLARVRGRYYLTVMAAGFDALVNERANAMRWPRGQARYTLATVAELPGFRARSYTLELDGVPRRLEATLVAVGNGPSFGGGLRITQGALLDDGLLDVVVIKPVTKVDLLRTYPRLYRGTHTSHPQYERHRARVVTVAAPGIVGYADGERFGPLPMTIECVPRALRVLA